MRYIIYACRRSYAVRTDVAGTGFAEQYDPNGRKPNKPVAMRIAINVMMDGL